MTFKYNESGTRREDILGGDGMNIGGTWWMGSKKWLAKSKLNKVRITCMRGENFRELGAQKNSGRHER